MLVRRGIESRIAVGVADVNGFASHGRRTRDTGSQRHPDLLLVHSFSNLGDEFMAFLIVEKKRRSFRAHGLGNFRDHNGEHSIQMDLLAQYSGEMKQNVELALGVSKDALTMIQLLS